MSSDQWNRLPLEDCMDAIIDYRGKTPRKSSFGIPLITAKIVKGGRILEPTEFIPFEDYDERMQRGIPESGDVVITTEGPLGEVGQLDNRKLSIGQRIITLRGKKGLLDNTYLKYLLMSHYVQTQLSARETGTTVSGIKQAELRKIELLIPPLPTQIHIAEILSALDDKIELNRQTNATLEAIAQAIFKEWFVDYNYPGATGEMVDSELGPIPKGWRVSSITSELNIVYGRTLPTTKLTAKGFPVFGGNGLLGFYENYLYDEPQVIVACRGAASGKVNQSLPKSFVTNNSLVFEIQKTSTITFPYLKFFCLNMDFRSFVSGSAQPQLTIDSLHQAKLLIPDSSIITTFSQVVSAIETIRIENDTQSNLLSTIRDELLPKFMTGNMNL